MKKGYLLGLLVLVLLVGLTGCKKEEPKKDEPKEEKKEWTILYDAATPKLTEDAKKVWDTASKNYRGVELTPVAYLGEQVVAGKNYMFLTTAESEGKKAYHIAIAYQDTKNKMTITGISDFDVTKYIGKDTQVDNTPKTGAWEVHKSNEDTELTDEKVQAAFEKAKGKLVGLYYTPITILAKQDNNYAILAYGTMSDQFATTGVYVVVLTDVNTETPGIPSITQIDLAELNK